MSNVLGIAKEQDEDQTFYSIRGIGEIYDEFYKWFNANIKTETSRDDWPWHIITLDDQNVEKLYENYSDYIYEVEELDDD